MSEEDGKFRPGERIGDYEVVSTLGFGATGTVYLAQHVVLKKLFAVKVLSGELAFMPEFVRVFQHEAQIVAALNHENIVAVHNFGECNGFYYYVMDFVNGGTLEDLRRRNGGRLRPADAVALIIAASRGLAYAHSYGIVHRDLKPENILLTRTGVPQITDFGMAHVDRKTPRSRQSAKFRPIVPRGGRLTPTRTQISIEENAKDKPEVEGGTEGYIAPEVARGNAATPRADVYALGALLHFLLVGETPPEPGRLSLEIYKLHNRALTEILDRALSLSPMRRYPTAKEFLEALLRVEAAPARRKRHIFYAVAGIAIAAAFGIVFSLGEKSQKGKTEQRVEKIFEAERGRAGSNFSATGTAVRERRNAGTYRISDTLRNSATHAQVLAGNNENTAGNADAEAGTEASEREYWEQLYLERFGQKSISLAVASDENSPEKISPEKPLAVFGSVASGTYNIYFRADAAMSGIEVPVRVSVGSDQVSRVVKFSGNGAGTSSLFFSHIDVANAADLVRIEVLAPSDEDFPEIALSEIEFRPTFSNADFSRMFGEFLSVVSEK